MTSSNEPKRLRQGKEVHKRIQKEWQETAEGLVYPERKTTKPSGKRGRMDIFVKSDERLVAVVEIKSSNWDVMTLNNLRRNVRRCASQIWDYVETELKSDKDVCPGVIFKKKPKERERKELIEHLCGEQGIAVVWEDESLPTRETV